MPNRAASKQVLAACSRDSSLPEAAIYSAVQNKTTDSWVMHKIVV